MENYRRATIRGNYSATFDRQVRHQRIDSPSHEIRHSKTNESRRRSHVQKAALVDGTLVERASDRPYMPDLHLGIQCNRLDLSPVCIDGTCSFRQVTLDQMDLARPKSTPPNL